MAAISTPPMGFMAVFLLEADREIRLLIVVDEERDVKEYVGEAERGVLGVPISELEVL